MIIPIYFILLFLLTLLSYAYYVVSLSKLLSERDEAPKWQRNYTPMVTVHVPVYNDLVVVRLLEALAKQDYPHYEVIVADDSTDERVRRAIDEVVRRFPEKIKVIRREHRRGFKAGALNNVLKYSKGEIIVVFDADFDPPKNFLREIVKPFSDPNISYVQARWDFENLDENIITLFSGVTLLVYHHLIYPLKNRTGVFYLSGTAMAIRKKVLEELGGWDESNITEDAELSMRMASAGYRGVYLPNLSALNQLPFTLKNFVRQQKRWFVGMLDALSKNWKRILFSKELTVPQKLVMLLIPLLSLTYILTALMLLISLLFWILRIPLFDTTTAYLLVLLLSGYLFSAYVALREIERTDLFPKFVVASYILGPFLSLVNSVAFISLIFAKVKPYWYVTQKRVGPWR